MTALPCRAALRLTWAVLLGTGTASGSARGRGGQGQPLEPGPGWCGAPRGSARAEGGGGPGERLPSALRMLRAALVGLAPAERFSELLESSDMLHTGVSDYGKWSSLPQEPQARAPSPRWEVLGSPRPRNLLSPRAASEPGSGVGELLPRQSRGPGLLPPGGIQPQPQNAPSSPPPGPRTGGGLRGHWSLPCFRLRPFTSYKLRLKATNDIGDSAFSAETEAVTTLQDGEQGGPLPAAASAPRNPGSWRDPLSS